MPICATWASSARRAPALALGAIAAIAAAQPTAPPPPPKPPVGGPAAAVGDEAVVRLQGAIAARKGDAPPIKPPALPAAGDADRRRAFDGIRRRTPQPAIERRARAAQAAARAALEAQQAAMAQQLGPALGLTAPDIAALAGGAPHASVPKAGLAPLLFVSSTMPVAVLQTYAADLARAGGAMAFRGLPGGLKRVAPMARLSADILKVDPGCTGDGCAMRDVPILVDPIAFRRHGITRVPALAMVPGDPAQAYCERDDQAPVPAGPLVYGDAALSGLLEGYARLGGSKEVRDAQARLQRR